LLIQRQLYSLDVAVWVATVAGMCAARAAFERRTRRLRPREGSLCTYLIGNSIREVINFEQTGRRKKSHSVPERSGGRRALEARNVTISKHDKHKEYARYARCCLGMTGMAKDHDARTILREMAADGWHWRTKFYTLPNTSKHK
jgi:hypothetical protein